jgi:hypothetical protein
LWPTIEHALGQSPFFVLLASPEAAVSKWVNKEVAYWLEHNSVETLLIAVTDGALAWDNATNDFTWGERTPLPPALTRGFVSEPKWVDRAADRSNTGWQRNLSVSYNKIGDVLREHGKLEEAFEAYRNSLAIRKRLAAADRSNTESVSYEKVGNAQLELGSLRMRSCPTATASPSGSASPPSIAAIPDGSATYRCLTSRSATCLRSKACSGCAQSLP